MLRKLASNRTLLAGTVLAVSCISFGATYEENLKDVRAYVISEEPLRFNKASLNLWKKEMPLANLKGSVGLLPPKGMCIGVSRGKLEEDIHVCEKTYLSFDASMLESTGKLTLHITRLGKKDELPYDIDLSTEYRVGKALWTDAKREGRSTRPLIIHECKLAPNEYTKRRIEVSVVGEETSWVIDFPPSDYLIAQPVPPLNLFYESNETKRGFIQAETAAKMQQSIVQKDGKEETNSSKMAREYGAAEMRGLDELLPDDADLGVFAKFKKKEDGEVDGEQSRKRTWQLSPYGTFSMNGSHFKASGSSPAGSLGRCQYNFEGSKEYPGTPTLECYDVDNIYLWLYVPLSCLKDIGPSHPPSTEKKDE